MKKIQSIFTVTLFFILLLGVAFLTVNFLLAMVEKFS